ncbi:MAG TPA: MaoC family dehydratase [Acidimicrobiia bacterium]|nr:MaoC family dehydratase [Acidimicrobiia bacterium]
MIKARAVRARNLEPDSENRIHRDDVARDFGFRGGLVPGITTYAYMSRVPAERWGEQWLDSGSMSAKFIAPVYDGDDLVISARTESSGLVLEVANQDGVVCAVGTATLDSRRGDAPDPQDYLVAPLPDVRPPATREVIEALGVLGTVRRGFHLERAPDFLEAIGDDLDLYAWAAHPGWLIYDANQALAQNVALGPWIHGASDVRHWSTLRDTESVCTRGRVARVFDRKGHGFVELDLLMTAGDAPDARVVWQVRHTAIYRIARP